MDPPLSVCDYLLYKYCDDIHTMTGGLTMEYYLFEIPFAAGLERPFALPLVGETLFIFRCGTGDLGKDMELLCKLDM